MPVYINSVTDAMDLYNSATGAWSTSQLSQKRGNLAAASVGISAFFAGGFSNSGMIACDSPARIFFVLMHAIAAYGDLVRPTVTVYSNATGMLSSGDTFLSQQRYCLAAVAVGNVAVFAGGSSTKTLNESKMQYET
jgi:hypothetical protein